MFGFLKVLKAQTSAAVVDEFNRTVSEAKNQALNNLDRVEQRNRSKAEKLQQVVVSLATKAAEHSAEANAAADARNALSA